MDRSSREYCEQRQGERCLTAENAERAEQEFVFMKASDLGGLAEELLLLAATAAVKFAVTVPGLACVPALLKYSLHATKQISASSGSRTKTS
jgi:hypothetical protein